MNHDQHNSAHHLRNHHHNWRKSKPNQASHNSPTSKRSSLSPSTSSSSSSSSSLSSSSCNNNNNNYNLAPNGAPQSLLDLSAKIVAAHIPFQSIERRYEHIPEPVQRRIIFWSFPRHEDDIKMYSSLSSDTFNTNAPQANASNITSITSRALSSSTSNTTTQSPSINQNNNNHNNAFAWIGDQHHHSSPIQAANNNISNNQSHHNSLNNQSPTSRSNTISSSSNQLNNKQLTFSKGLKLYNEGCVKDVLQVGFNLSGLVTIRLNPINQPTTTGARMRGNNHSSNNHTLNIQINNNNNNNNNINNINNNHNNNINHIHNNNHNYNNHHNNINNVDILILNNQNQAPPTYNEPTNATFNDPLITKNYRVSVTFDRCKITSVSCSCELQDIFWCEHVVALILYRIRNPETIDLRVPISETLLSLDRQQLQKLVQYIIAEHHTEVLPTAQRLLDEMRQSFSEINRIQGAPDPTAGASSEDEHIWHLDEYQVNEKVQNYLNLVFSNSKDACKHINALFEKIREMFRAKDSNGTRLLKLITEQFLLHATRNEKSRHLWDQLVSLWVVVMLNPDLSKSNKKNFIQLLNNWSRVSKCPKEDTERKVVSKRKLAELSDDEDSDDYTYNPYYPFSLNQSNNYPAHQATHRHRAFQPNNDFPVLRNFNQPPISPSTCPCQLSLPSIAKKMKSHHMQHAGDSSNTVNNRGPRPSNSSSNPSSSRNVGHPSNENRIAVPQEPKSVFHRALDFQDASWDDPHLQLILQKDGPVYLQAPSNLFDSHRNPLWNEHISQAAARIETLRSHGYREQSLRLTVATVRRLKLQQDQWCRTALNSTSEPICLSEGLENYSEGWLGHPFDPINVIVDILLEASLTEASNTSSNTVTSNSGVSTTNTSRCPCSYNQAIADLSHFLPDLASIPYPHSILPDFASLSYTHRVAGVPILPLVNFAPRRTLNSPSQSGSDKTQYYHVAVTGSCPVRWKDSYLTLAVEVALMALGQQRSIPTIATAYDRAVRQESELIAKLESIDTSDPLLIEILKHQTTLLLEGGPFQNSCCGVPTDSAPLHTFARYLFDSLISHYPQLAYKVGVYALRMPLLNDENGENFGAARTSPRSINHNHLQTEQLALAQTMLSKAKDEGQQSGYLKRVYKASVKNIRNPASLLKLSKHVLKEAKPNVGKSFPKLLETSFDLGLEVLKITLSPHTSNGKTRREAILFIVECATDIGPDAVCKVMKEARYYFSPIEALNLVVARDSDHVNIRSQASTKLKLKDNTELNRRSRDLVLECATLDPANCALEALKFCETDKYSSEIAFQTVIDAGTAGKMDSSQLIEVAKHMYSGGKTDKAFQIALVAVDSLSIPSNSDNSSLKKDIERACEYAQEVTGGFSILIPKLINNIECATSLSDIYQHFGPSSEKYRSKLIREDENLNLPSNIPNEILNKIKNDMHKQRIEDAKCWDALLRRTLEAFMDTTRTRLQNISPRHYGEFVDFLVKAQDTFKMAAGGPQQFKNLIFEIMKSYRTKKKLMERLKASFDYSIKTCL